MFEKCENNLKLKNYGEMSQVQFICRNRSGHIIYKYIMFKQCMKNERLIKQQQQQHCSVVFLFIL